ncbi:MAG: hypothetical protein CFH44_00085 [Proteobacteria bacterium]|nr:MAG: hypothetical protein CFH44_00085 [Pseudomonadota bacterium]|tara:strand:+ start:169 stop:588 length:420 start_codon:yes stop_codon:yes gene_type:complete
MSKTLNTLLKISQKKLDDQTQVIADLNNKKQAFIDEKTRLKQAIITEIDSVKDDSLGFNMAHNFAVKAKAGIAYLDDQMIKIDELIEQEKEVMKGLFLEKKRHEILLEEYNRKKKAEYNKKVQNQMDDFNSIAFINKAK